MLDKHLLFYELSLLILNSHIQALNLANDIVTSCEVTCS